MNIGRVLLRDVHYVWRERVAFLEKDAVVLQCPSSAWQAAASAVTMSSKKTKTKRHPKSKRKLLTRQRSNSRAPTPTELLPLDGSLSCEGIVVSSAHMHSVQLHDLRSGRDFLLDATTKGKKQIWIDLFSNARTPANIGTSWRKEVPFMDTEGSKASQLVTLLDLQQAVEMLVTATSDAEAAVVQGSDVEKILLGDGSAVDFTSSDAAELARKLVDEGVLQPFCCSCCFVYHVDRVYRINGDHYLVKEAQMMTVENVQEAEKLSRQGRCHGHLLWLHDRAFQTLLEQFNLQEDGEEGLTGTDGVRILLRFGAYSVPTALALANELLYHEFIMECVSRDDKSLETSYLMNTTVRYKKVCIDDTNGDNAEQRHAIVTSEQVERLLEDSRRLEVQIQKLQEKNLRLFNLFCFCCVLVLLDALVTTVMLPGPLKLSLVTGLLLWLALSGGSTSFFINFYPRNEKEELSRTSRQLRPKKSDTLIVEAAKKLTPTPSTRSAMNRRGSVTVEIMRQESLDRAIITLTRAEEAEVHSFRLAIAQAAVIPVERTHVFSNEYLFSVLRVKNRAFAYAVTKMARIMEWRRVYQVDAITWDDVKEQLTSGSMYWYGYDFQNRPILWVRAKLKNWKTMANRRDVEVRAHVFLLELGHRLFMPPGVTTYSIVTDSSGFGMAQVDLRLMRELLDVCVANFPDRIGLVHAGPLTRFLKYITSWLWPFLPVRLRGKVSLMHDCVVELRTHMDTEIIPLHMGGTAMHNLRPPILNPTEADDIMDITYMIDQQKRFMEELKLLH